MAKILVGCPAAERGLAGEGALFRVFDHIDTRPGGREELLEDISDDFGYLAVRSEHDRYHEKTVPWHWHQEIEFFYVVSGSVDYATPNERVTLGVGAGGFVNANVLHSTRATGGEAGATLLVHEVRPRLLAEPGSLLWRSYVAPVIDTTSIELALADPGSALAGALRSSFEMVARGDEGWEMRVRDRLSEVWLGFLDELRPRLDEGPARFDRARDERLKAMLDYVGLHYADRLSVADMAAAAYSSERECHRTFRECLGQTPAQYLRDYRIQQACRMLAHTTRPVAAVAHQTGLGTASHFGKVFKEAMGQTPSEYRRAWQDLDSRCQPAE